jgi:hypothetical protein
VARIDVLEAEVTVEITRQSSAVEYREEEFADGMGETAKSDDESDARSGANGGGSGSGRAEACGRSGHDDEVVGKKSVVDLVAIFVGVTAYCVYKKLREWRVIR